ncbi:MAG: BlaI/MecI/CopY family transcriptional regulator [Pseudomonadota bacterium]
MSDSPSPDPTKPELAILKLLWREPHLTARAIHSEIGQKFDWSYSTVRTVLERMSEKGLIFKNTDGAANTYSASVGKIALLGRIISDFSARVMELDAPPTAAFFADSKLLDDDEIAELEAVLREADK